jgi:hypothetical protein
MSEDPNKNGGNGLPGQDPAPTAPFGTVSEGKHSAGEKGQNGIDQLLTDFLSELNKLSGDLGNPALESVAQSAKLQKPTEFAPRSRRDGVPEFLKAIGDIQSVHPARRSTLADPAARELKTKTDPELRVPKESVRQELPVAGSAGWNETRPVRGAGDSAITRPQPELARPPDPELSRTLRLLEKKQAKILRKHAGSASSDPHASHGRSWVSKVWSP